MLPPSATLLSSWLEAETLKHRQPRSIAPYRLIRMRLVRGEPMHCITCTLAEPGTPSRVVLLAARGKLKKSAPE